MRSALPVRPVLAQHICAGNEAGQWQFGKTAEFIVRGGDGAMINHVPHCGNERQVAPKHIQGALTGKFAGHSIHVRLRRGRPVHRAKRCRHVRHGKTGQHALLQVSEGVHADRVIVAAAILPINGKELDLRDGGGNKRHLRAAICGNHIDRLQAPGPGQLQRDGSAQPFRRQAKVQAVGEIMPVVRRHGGGQHRKRAVRTVDGRDRGAGERTVRPDATKSRTRNHHRLQGARGQLQMCPHVGFLVGDERDAVAPVLNHLDHLQRHHLDHRRHPLSD